MEAPESLDQRATTALIMKHPGLRPGQGTLDSTFVGLGVDSVDGMDLLLPLDQVFRVPIPDDIDRHVRTVRDASCGPPGARGASFRGGRPVEMLGWSAG